MEWKLDVTALMLLLLLLTIAFLLLCERLITAKHQAREPPLVRQRIPYVGHVAGLFLHGMKYFEFTRYEYASRYTMN